MIFEVSSVRGAWSVIMSLEERSSENDTDFSVPVKEFLLCTQRFFPVAEIRTFYPVAVFNRIVMKLYKICEIQDEGKNMLSNRFCRIGRNVCNNNISFGAGFKVYDIIACGKNAYVFKVWT